MTYLEYILSRISGSSLAFSLFNLQGTSRCLLSKQLIYITTSEPLCQEKLSSFFDRFLFVCASLASDLIIISPSFRFVNTFHKIILKFLYVFTNCNFPPHDYTVCIKKAAFSAAFDIQISFSKSAGCASRWVQASPGCRVPQSARALSTPAFAAHSISNGLSPT